MAEQQTSLLRCDLLGVLRDPAGRHAGKVWTRDAEGRWGPIPYTSGREWKFGTVEISSVRELYDFARRASRAGDTVFIRGRARPEMIAPTVPGDEPRQRVRRTSNGANPYFEDQPVHSAMLDADKVVIAGHYDLRRPEDRDAVVEEIRAAVFPEEFRTVSYGYQLSSSTGVPEPVIQPGEKVSVHFFFFFAEARDSRRMKRLVQTRCVIAAPHEQGSGRLSQGVDPSIYNPVHPHYVADPTFRDWQGALLPDPVPQRFGFIQKANDEVVIEDPAEEVVRKVERQRREAGGPITHANSVEEALGQIGIQGVNGPCWKAMELWVRGHPTGMPSKAEMEAFVGDIRRRIIEAYPNIEQTNEGGYRDRYLYTDALEDMLRRSVLNLGSDVAVPDDWRPPTRLPAADAIAEIEAAVARFIEQHESMQSPVMVIRGTPGTTKTDVALRMFKPLIEAGRRVNYAVPHHKLSGEVQDRIGLGSIWYGLERLCHPDMLEDALRVQSFGMSVNKHLCGDCPFRDGCEYQAQQDLRTAPGLLIHSHNLLTQPVRPAEVTVIDEEFWPSMLRETTIPFGELAGGDARDYVPDANGLKDDHATDFLGIHRKLAAECFDGDKLMPGALRARGINDSVARQMAIFESYRREHFEENFDLGRRNLEEANGANALRHRRFWKLVERSLAKDHEHVAGVFREDKDQLPHVRAGDVSLTWTGSVDYGTSDEFGLRQSFLILDGTANREVVEKVCLPGHLADLEGGPGSWSCDWVQIDAAPDETVEVIACSDWSGGKSTQKTEAGELSRRMQSIRNEVASSVAKGKTVSVITHKDIRLDFKDEQLVRQGTFGSMVGSNIFWQPDWKAETHIVIGRTLPPAAAAIRMAEAVFERPVLRGVGYQRTAKVQELHSDGRTGMMVDGVWAHPDPAVEAIRYQTCEAALVQDLHRARAIHAGPERRILIFAGDVTVEFPVSRRARFADMVASRVDVMLARGIVPTTKAALHQLHPDLFETEKTADHFLNRELDPKPLLDTYREMGLSSVRLQNPGRGARSFEVLVRDPSIAADLAERLGARLVSVTEPKSDLPKNLSGGHFMITETQPILSPPVSVSAESAARSPTHGSN